MPPAMKTLLFDRDHSSAPLLPPELTMIADSAITGHARPVFLPDFDSEWIAEFYLAVRISRLGKTVAEKFASRYFDAMTVAMRLVPVTLRENLRLAGRPDAVISIFDNALTAGTWIPSDSFKEMTEVQVNETHATLSHVSAAAAEAVAAVSRYATIKTGDLLMPYRIAPSTSVTTGTHVTCSLDGNECINLKIH
mgnify:CR=1 FL=1